jgi:tetratricopeptide (TPR) repeat protein
LSYTDEKIKWQECAEAFERLANEEPGYYDAVARYFAGICYTRFDPDKGARLLQEAIDRGDQQTADQARLALAQHHAASDQLEKAIALYEALTNSPWFPKQTARFGLGKLYESSGDVAKAVEAYFEAAKEDRTAGTTSDAEKRLSALAPERVKELPPPASTLPTP